MARPEFNVRREGDNLWRGFTVDVMYDIVYKRDHKDPIILQPRQVAPVRSISDFAVGYNTSIHTYTCAVLRDIAGRPWWGTKDGRWLSADVAGKPGHGLVGYGCGATIHNLSDSELGLCTRGRHDSNVRSMLWDRIPLHTFYDIDSKARRINNCVYPIMTADWNGNVPDKKSAVRTVNDYVPRFWVAGDAKVQSIFNDMDRTSKWRMLDMYDVSSGKIRTMVELPIPWLQQPLDDMFPSGDLKSIIWALRHRLSDLMYAAERDQIYVGTCSPRVRGFETLFEDQITDIDDDDDDEEKPRKAVLNIQPACAMVDTRRALTDVEYARQQLIPCLNGGYHSLSSAGVVPSNRTNMFGVCTSPRAVLTTDYLVEGDVIHQFDAEARAHIHTILSGSGVTDRRFVYSLTPA